MHAGKNFSLKGAILWTKGDILKFVILSTVVTVAYESLNFKWLAIPWLPLTLIGTAVAFLIGFKNNASYDRLWEARKIYGRITNSSRTWAMMVKGYVTNRHAIAKLSEKELKDIHQRLIYRHISWLTALRFQLRQPRKWESMDRKHNKGYKKRFKISELESEFENECAEHISKEEKNIVIQKRNPALHIIDLQSKELTDLLDKGLIEDFRHMEMENILKDFYDQQGGCERIKNFPYPRQFATLNVHFVWLFIILLPFGMVHEFARLGDHFIWLTIPFSTLVSWVFHTMEKIGESTENPFQGGANDVPITAISRSIEIDLKEMLGEEEIPDTIEPLDNILL